MGKVCYNSRREAILHVTQNAAKHITQPQQQRTSPDVDQPKRHRRHRCPKIQIRAAVSVWPCFA